MAALPLDSNGRMITRIPAAINSAPLVYTGAEVWRFANMATMGYQTMVSIAKYKFEQQRRRRRRRGGE